MDMDIDRLKKLSGLGEADDPAMTPFTKAMEHLDEADNALQAASRTSGMDMERVYEIHGMLQNLIEELDEYSTQSESGY